MSEAARRASTRDIDGVEFRAAASRARDERDAVAMLRPQRGAGVADARPVTNNRRDAFRRRRRHLSLRERVGGGDAQE